MFWPRKPGLADSANSRPVRTSQWLTGVGPERPMRDHEPRSAAGPLRSLVVECLHCGSNGGCRNLAMWRFVKAILLGALAAAAAPMIFTTGLGVIMVGDVVRGHQEAWRVLYLALLPLIVAVPVVFAAGLIVGLPTTALLKWRRQESREAYVSVGIIAGSIIPLAVLGLMHAPSGYWTAFLGAVGGGVAAYVWWSSAPDSTVI